MQICRNKPLSTVGALARALPVLLGLALAPFSLRAAAPAPDLGPLLQQSGPPGGTFDGAPLLRLESLVREAKSTEQKQALELQLLKWLEPETPLRAKEYACRILWQIGTAQSAPALKRLLADPTTVAVACYAIASNPDPALGQILRESLPGSSGRGAISIINLLGQRRDAQAITAILAFLKQEPVDISQAAVEALGKIGTAPAATALEAFSRTVPEDRRVGVEESWMRAVETLDSAASIAICQQAVAAAGHTVMARRLALLQLSRRAPGEAVPPLLAALGDEQSDLRPVAGHALRNFRGQPAGTQMAQALRDLPGSSQIIVLTALGDTFPVDTLVPLLPGPSGPVRLAALGALGARGGAPAATLLLNEVLTTTNPDERSFVLHALKTMPGKDAAQQALRVLPTAPAGVFLDLTKLVSACGDKVPLSLVVDRIRSSPPAAQGQVLSALKVVATARDHAELFKLLETTEAPEIHAAIVDEVTRTFARSDNAEEQAQWLIAEFKAARRPLDRQAFLQLLARTGTKSALARILDVIHGGGPAPAGSSPERDAAFRGLCDWPNEGAIPALLELAGQPGRDADHAMALRGISAQLAASTQPAAEKLKHLRAAVALARDAADKKQLLSTLTETVDAGSLSLILPWVSDPAVRSEAALAAITVARQLPKHDPAVTAAMKTIAQALPEGPLRNQARALINR